MPASPAIPLAEFDLEMDTTRKLLDRVPEEQHDWKPHVKSFSLGHLAQLLSSMPGWIAQTLHHTELDLAAGRGYGTNTKAELLDGFDQGVAASRTALSSVTGSGLAVSWSLRRGDQVLWTAPRREVVRSHLNHLIHHRGQLSVYLRLVEVPLPSIYGPTADTKW
jgi:uncharacterized damage-inducible protein DinB